jgi:hypothetical protein
MHLRIHWVPVQFREESTIHRHLCPRPGDVIIVFLRFVASSYRKRRSISSSSVFLLRVITCRSRWSCKVTIKSMLCTILCKCHIYYSINYMATFNESKYQTLLFRMWILCCSCPKYIIAPFLVDNIRLINLQFGGIRDIIEVNFDMKCSTVYQWWFGSSSLSMVTFM